METETKKNAPERGSAGRVQFKIWTNTDDHGKTRRTVDFYRSFKEKKEGAEEAGEWKVSHTFSFDDLLAIDHLIPDILKKMRE